MSKVVLTAERLLTPEKSIPQPSVVVEDGTIRAIVSRSLAELPAGETLDFPGCVLVPAYFDVHVHGSAGYDLMDGSDEAFRAVSRFLARRGVGAFFPTTVTANLDATLRALSAMASRLDSDFGGARCAGIHLEGPFLSHIKRGVHPPQYLQDPSVDVFDSFWQAADGRITLMTIAPELPGSEELIAHAASLGVRVSLGHSDAGVAETLRGIRAGGTSATHTFNAMRSLNHRDPGIAAVVLDEDRLFAEIIADGHHVDPLLVRLFWKAKGPQRSILVTDGISATGMPDGNYTLGGMEVEVKDGICLLDGVLAGSTLTMDRAVQNFHTMTGVSLDIATALAARNPAAMTGLSDRIGTLAVGRAADIAVLTPAGSLVATLLGGRRVAAA